MVYRVIDHNFILNFTFNYTQFSLILHMINPGDLAPIVLFTYNRPWHTKETIRALQENQYAGDSIIYIYSEGAKNDSVVESVQKVRQILVDCDQDCLILKVKVDQGQCHVGYQSCFYRGLKAGTQAELQLVAEKVYDPAEAYKK